MRELAGLAFVERSENVILPGPPSGGKTHLAVSPDKLATEAGAGKGPARGEAHRLDIHGAG